MVISELTFNLFYLKDFNNKTVKKKDFNVSNKSFFLRKIQPFQLILLM